MDNCHGVDIMTLTHEHKYTCPQHVIYDVGNNYTLKEPNDISETTNETKHKPTLLLDTYYADVCLGWTSGDISCLACA